MEFIDLLGSFGGQYLVHCNHDNSSGCGSSKGGVGLFLLFPALFKIWSILKSDLGASKLFGDVIILGKKWEHNINH